MSTMLLGMNKDEATVAESVTTYKRAEIEEKFPILLEQYRKDQQRLAELEAEIKELKPRLEANAITVDLYGALLEAFNQNHPKEQVQPASEVPAVSEAPAEESTFTTTDIPDSSPYIPEEEIPAAPERPSID